jgi:zinc transport system permease protein
MIDLLSLGFMQRALLGGLVVSLMCGALSVFIILRRMAFIGVGISHSAFGGVALGFYLAIDPFYSGVGFAIGVALLIEWAQSRGRVEEDAAIGILFAASMALGVIFLHASRTYNVDVFSILFGNILAIGPGQLVQICVVALVVLGLLAAFAKELVFLSFDEEMAWVCGVPTTFLRCLFLVLLALAVVVSIYLVGIILVSALMVIPAAAARYLTRHLRPLLLASVGFALVSTVLGLGLSFYLDMPSGACIVLLLAFFFFLAAAGSRWGQSSLTRR